MRGLSALILFLLAISCISFSFLGDQSYERYQSARARLEAQVATNDALQDKVRVLRKEAVGVQENPRLLEKAARNELGMARAGEIVFIFED